MFTMLINSESRIYTLERYKKLKMYSLEMLKMHKKINYCKSIFQILENNFTT